MKKPARTIPAIFQAIRNAELKDISRYENLMVSMYASSLLFLAAIANLVVRFYILSQEFTDSIWDSLLFLVLGAAFHIVEKIRMNDKQITRMIAGLSFVTLLFYTVRFYEIIGPAVWIAVFIQLVLAMIRITKEMYYSVCLAAVLSNIYIFIHYPQGFSYDIPAVSMIVHITLFIIMLIITAGVHKINIDRYHTLETEYKNIIQKKQEISELNEVIAASHEETKYLAYHDNLTGLPNRLLLYEQIDHAISLAKRTRKMIAVLFLDLDGFKMINDTLGHTMGDQLLIDVSKRLVNTVRECDIVARIGGDEFNIMTEEIENMESIHIFADKILKCFDKPFILQNQEWFVSTSIGVAVYPVDGTDAIDLIKNADIAMYKAKENGKNQYVLCSPLIKDKVLETMQLNNDLYRAMERHELELYYQPQISCTSGQIVGMEALIRWNHPEYGLVAPGKFIPIAEQSGLIIPIGEWVLTAACRQNKVWQDAGYPPIRMAVNLSVKQLQHPNFIKQVENALHETGLNPRYLELEITESYAMKEKDEIAYSLRRLKEMGIQIAIDDFGIAYSTMTYLKVIPADIIKIDQTFVQGIKKDKTDEAITKSIIALAKNMGIYVIAEGVETAKQRDFLVQEMCDEIQGFYYSKPMPLDMLERVWRKKINANVNQGISPSS